MVDTINIKSARRNLEAEFHTYIYKYEAQAGIEALEKFLGKHFDRIDSLELCWLTVTFRVLKKHIRQVTLHYGCPSILTGMMFELFSKLMDQWETYAEDENQRIIDEARERSWYGNLDE